MFTLFGLPTLVLFFFATATVNGVINTFKEYWKFLIIMLLWFIAMDCCTLMFAFITKIY